MPTKDKIKMQMIIDKNLKRKFKAACAENEITLTEAIEEALNHWLIKKAKEGQACQ